MVDLKNGIVFALPVLNKGELKIDKQTNMINCIQEQIKIWKL